MDKLLPFGIAKLTKQLGINIYRDVQKTSATYFSDGSLHYIKGEGEFPTVQLDTFQTWLRDQHHIHIDIRHNAVSHPKWFVCVMRIQKEIGGHIATVDNFKSYEDALIGGILIVLKGLKSK